MIVKLVALVYLAEFVSKAVENTETGKKVGELGSDFGKFLSESFKDTLSIFKDFEGFKADKTGKQNEEISLKDFVEFLKTKEAKELDKKIREAYELYLKDKKAKAENDQDSENPEKESSVDQKETPKPENFNFNSVEEEIRRRVKEQNRKSKKSKSSNDDQNRSSEQDWGSELIEVVSTFGKILEYAMKEPRLAEIIRGFEGNNRKSSDDISTTSSSESGVENKNGDGKNTSDSKE